MLHVRTITHICLACGLLYCALAAAQALPPPGVGAARPPTERTLQPVDRSQTQDRVPVGRDCKREVSDIRGQYRIQQQSVTTQYVTRIEDAQGEARKALEAERDAKISALKAESKAAEKKIGALCKADNASLLKSESGPIDVPMP